MNKKFKKIVSASSLLLVGSMGFNNTLNLPTSYKVVAANRDIEGIFKNVFGKEKDGAYVYENAAIKEGTRVWFIIEDANGNRNFFTEMVTSSNYQKISSRDSLVFLTMFKDKASLELNKENVEKLGGLKEGDRVIFVEKEKLDETQTKLNEFKAYINKYNDSAINTFLYRSNKPFSYYRGEIPVNGLNGRNIDYSTTGNDYHSHGSVPGSFIGAVNFFVQKPDESEVFCGEIDQHTGQERIFPCRSTWSLPLITPNINRDTVNDRIYIENLKIEWKDGVDIAPLEKDQSISKEYRLYFEHYGEKIYMSDNYKVAHFHGSSRLYDKHDDDNVTGFYMVIGGRATGADDWDVNNYSLSSNLMNESFLSLNFSAAYTLDSIYNVTERGLLLVHHVDKQGKKLSPSTSKYGDVGNNYKTKSLDIDKYKVINDKPNNYEGSFIKGTVEVTYVYDRLPEPSVPTNPTPSLPSTGSNNKLQTFSLISLVSALLLFIGYKKK